MKQLFFPLCFMAATSLFATTITAIGYGKTKSLSQKDALSSLSEQIAVKVQSSYSSTQTDTNSKSVTTINTTSSLPILSAKLTVTKGNNEYITKAALDSNKALKLYSKKLTILKNAINRQNEAVKKEKNSALQYALYKKLLSRCKEYDNYKTVALFLGATSLQQPQTTTAEVEIKLLQLMQNTTSLDLVAQQLSYGLEDLGKLYLVPVKTKNSKEVTPFARVLKLYMRKRVQEVKKPDNADYIVRGEYEILPKSVFITLYVYDKSQNIFTTKTALIDKKALQNYPYQPTQLSFDTAMNNSVVSNGNFYAHLGFRGYNQTDGIDLQEGESVDIVLKTNHSMCYFIVGHVLHKNKNFSYLLPIGSDEEPFSNYITGSDVNRYITIAQDVTIEAPFGKESIQLFGATLKPSGECPLVVPHCKENQQGYCIISTNPNEAIRTTRGLNFKRRSKTIQKTQATMSWTSFAAVNK